MHLSTLKAYENTVVSTRRKLLADGLPSAVPEAH